MAKVDLKKLVDHLNSACRQALEEAASLTVANGHREVMIEHFLLALTQMSGGCEDDAARARDTGGGILR